MSYYAHAPEVGVHEVAVEKVVGGRTSIQPQETPRIYNVVLWDT